MHDQVTAPGLTAPPDPARARIAVIAPESGREAWAGSPSAILAGGEIYLAYRLRAPRHRGYAVKVARSADGVRFETLLTIGKDQMDSESLERPALVVTEDGRWRLYLSCATWGTKHWRVELIEAPSPDRFDPVRRSIVLPGDTATAVKDPVIVQRDGAWHLWAAMHPLTDPGHTDRMWTGYATSTDGLAWTWRGAALDPRTGEWDARGARVTAVRFTPGGVTAYYDGRATAAQNCEERTGIAVGAGPGQLSALGNGPVAQSAYPGHGLRYLSVVALGDGRERLYYELTNAGGSHDLVTELRPAPA
jgi:hypothetical protein